MYGLTECYGPSTVCAWQDEWSDLPLDQKSALMARQGVRYPTLFAQAVMNPDTMTSVPADGKTDSAISFDNGEGCAKGAPWVWVPVWTERRIELQRCALETDIGDLHRSSSTLFE